MPSPSKAATTARCSGEWTESCCGGAPPSRAWADNPQFALRPAVEASFTISLKQEDGCHSVALWVLEAERDDVPVRGDFVGFVAKAIGETHCSLTAVLAARPYVLFAATVEPGMRGRFAVEVTSGSSSGTSRAMLAPLWPGAVGAGAYTSRLSDLPYVAPYVPPRGASPAVPPPAGWETALDQSGALYYYHKITRRAQYERPAEPGAGNVAASDGWHVTRDEHGKEYYWNETTYSTSYEPPPAVETAEEEARRFEFDPPLPRRRAASETDSNGGREREEFDGGGVGGPGGGGSDAAYEFGGALRVSSKEEFTKTARERPGEVRERIAEVEKEALRLRALLTDQAEIAWRAGVMKQLRSRPSAEPTLPLAPTARPRSSKAPAAVPAVARSRPWAEGVRQAADPTTLRSHSHGDRSPTAQWVKRLERGRATSQRAVMVDAAERVRTSGEEALLECGYAPEILRIKREKRRPMAGVTRSTPTAGASASASAGHRAGGGGDAGLPPRPRGASGGQSDVDRFLSSTASDATATWQVLSHERTLGGTRGGRAGQFNGPAFVTMLPGGDLVVADSGNDRLQVVRAPPKGGGRASTAEVKRVLGARRVGGPLHEMQPDGRPHLHLRLGRGVACDRSSGVLYAIDMGKAADGASGGAAQAAEQRGGGGANGGGLAGRLNHHPQRSTAPAAATVRKLRLDGSSDDLVLGSSAPGDLVSPEGMALSEDGMTLAVADSARHRIALFHAPSLQAKGTLGRKGSARGQLRCPDGVAMHEGKLYVADVYNHRVAVFHLDRGTALTKDKALRDAMAPGGCERIIGQLGSDPVLRRPRAHPRAHPLAPPLAPAWGGLADCHVP